MLTQAIIRIALAGLVGIIIGWASRSDPGARLFSLICMGCALLSVVSTEYFQMFILPGNVDPGRLSAQVISALGFIGSGLIWLGESKEVRGTGPAASLWLTAILGILIGAGLSSTTAGAIFFTMLVLMLNNKIDIDKLLGPKTENIYVKSAEKDDPIE